MNENIDSDVHRVKEPVDCSPTARNLHFEDSDDQVNEFIMRDSTDATTKRVKV